jgi:hypothetical protein
MLRCGSVADPQRSRRSLASHAKRAISFLYVLFVLPCIASDRLRDPLCKAKSYQASWRLSADTGANGRRSKVIARRFYDTFVVVDSQVFGARKRKRNRSCDRCSALVPSMETKERLAVFLVSSAPPDESSPVQLSPENGRYHLPTSFPNSTMTQSER